MKRILPSSFYERDTRKVARDLLGKYLVRQVGNQKLVGQIIETEAYCGPNDLACHASRGRTPRTEILFGPPGFWYVYLIYGMYYCLNIVTEAKNYPAAVLIRSLAPISGISDNIKTNGPGKLCRALMIDKKCNNTPGFKKSNLCIEDWGDIISPKKIKKTPRIGVDYAGKYKDKPWRFILDAEKNPRI